jgi:putative transposase
LVDTGGLVVMKATGHPADLADREGAKVLLDRVGEAFPNLRHLLWADAGYRGADDLRRRWITEGLGLSSEIVQRRSRWVWVRNDDVEPGPIPAAGFEVIRRRWVVERTFARICRNRRMRRDYEFLAQTTEASIYVTMIRLMLRRLARGAT